jgi:hypothetical protein
MKSLLPLHRDASYASLTWYKSRCLEQVSFAVRRPSLAQRIDLTERVRNLTLKHEFLAAGNLSDQLTASLSELLVRKLYLEWGLAEIKGLKIDGEPACTLTLVDRGPEDLADEIVQAIKAETGLSEDERKNS